MLFRDLSLPLNAPDALIWRTCQAHQLILLTGNRNADGADSLEATLRTHNTSASLPVLTIADTEQLLRSRDYADRVVGQMLEYLLDIEQYRGTGRLFLP